MGYFPTPSPWAQKCATNVHTRPPNNPTQLGVRPIRFYTNHSFPIHHIILSLFQCYICVGSIILLDISCWRCPGLLVSEGADVLTNERRVLGDAISIVQWEASMRSRDQHCPMRNEYLPVLLTAAWVEQRPRPWRMSQLSFNVFNRSQITELSR